MTGQATATTQIDKTHELVSNEQQQNTYMCTVYACAHLLLAPCHPQQLSTNHRSYPNVIYGYLSFYYYYFVQDSLFLLKKSLLIAQ